MKVKTMILTATCSCLLFLSSCQSSHKKEATGHKHLHKQEKQHDSNKVSIMKVKAPNRISHTYEQTINGVIKNIMPLYCPVRELDWCENWNPKTVYSNSGVVEKDCIFITSHGDDDVVWIVTEYNEDKGCVEMYYHVPNILVTKLEIKLTPIDENHTKAILIYSKTSLSKTGDKVLEDFTKEEYDIMMNSWEKAMNHYLETGEMLTGLPNF